MCRDGRLQVGDEIVNIDGKRLRGLRLDRARQLLATCPNVADAVISRTATVIAAAAAEATLVGAQIRLCPTAEEEENGGDLIHLTSPVLTAADEEADELVVRPTIITVGGGGEGMLKVEEDEEEVDEVEGTDSTSSGISSSSNQTVVELVHTTVDTPQVTNIYTVETHCQAYVWITQKNQNIFL
jgi:hypothetical protein